MRNAYKILVGQHEAKRPRVKPRRKWDDNIKTDFKIMARDDVNWIQVPQDWVQWQTLLNTVINFRVR
jgi:hypothetical protein